jgi:hypothetical protein
MGIRTYSTTPASNQLAVPNGWPEGMAPSSVNDCARQNMADIRSWYEDAEWTDLGHTPTRTGNTTFTIPTDVTSYYTVGRRVKCTDSSTLYGTISASSYSSPNTTITLDLDSGALSASLTNIYVSILKPAANSMHANLGRKGTAIASASTVDLSAATGDFVDVSGTTTITALGTMNAGIFRVVRFTGALTLTHNATSLILPGSANITTTNGDIATFRSLGSGNWVCVGYTKASGASIIGVSSIATSGLASGGTITTTGTITVTAAVKSDQTTATSNSVAVTPGVQQYHPSSAKAWVSYQYSAGVPGILQSYNVASLTDVGVGIAGVVFTTAMTSSNYPALMTQSNDGAGLTNNSSTATTGYQVLTRTTGFAATDTGGIVSTCAFGGQ